MVLEKIQSIIKQLDNIRIIGEYGDTEHSVFIGENNGYFIVNRDGATLLTTQDPKEAVSLFYAQISSIYDDTKRNMDSNFATLREILLSRNDFVRGKLDELGEGSLSKALSLLDFNGDITEGLIHKQIDYFAALLNEMQHCEKCNAKPLTTGLGEIEDESVFVGNPKPNNSGMFTYSQDFKLSSKNFMLENSNVTLFEALSPIIKSKFNVEPENIELFIS